MKASRGTTPGIVESLYPIESHDPTVEPQRQGYCVMTDPRLFACPVDKQTHGVYMGLTYRFGWCTCEGPVRGVERSGECEQCCISGEGDRDDGAVLERARTGVAGADEEG